MIYFVASVLLLSPLILGFLNNIKNKQTPLYVYILTFLGFSQISLVPFIITKNIGFDQYKVLSFLFIFLFIFLTISYIGYYWIKYKPRIDWKKYCQYLLIFFIVIFSLIFILLTFYSSNNTNNDLNFYINISKNFEYSIFSSGPNIIDGSSSISDLSNFYLYPQMYYFYGALFTNNISLSYILLNSIVYILLIASIVNSLINYFFKNANIIIKSILIVAITFAAISSLYINVAAGNLAIQSLILLILVLNIFATKDNDKLILYYFSFYGLSFFSSTGLLNSIIPIIIFSCVCCFRYGTKTLLISIPFFILSLFYNAITFTSFLSNNILSISISMILIIFILTDCAVYKIFKGIKNFKVDNWLKKANKSWCFWLLLFAFLATILLTCINIFIIQPKLNLCYFNKNLCFLYLVLMLILTATFIIEWKKEKIIYLFIVLLFLTNFLSTIEYIIFSFVTKSASLWRLIYLLPGMGNIPDTIIMVCLVLCLLLNKLNIINKLKKTRIGNILISKKGKYVSLSVLAALVSSMTMVSSYTSLFTPANQTLSNDVSYNLNFASDKDIKILNNINFDNWNKTYITDMPIYQYLNQGTDLTGYINYSIGITPTASYHWNYADFYHGIDYWNDEHPNDLMQKTPEQMVIAINKIINNVKSWNLKNLNNNQINSLDYIILNKNTSYFSYLINNYSNLYKNQIIGDNIVVLFK